MDAAALLHDEIRELVRRRGIDPLNETSALEALVAEASADYVTRADAGLVPPLHDPDDAQARAVDALAGLGPLQHYLDDDSIEEVWCNAPGRVFVARAGRPELTTTILEDEDLRVLVERMLRVSGRRLDLSSPFVDAQMPAGERLHVVIPPITARHWAVNIRKHSSRASRTADLVRLGSLTPRAAAFLDASVQAGGAVVAMRGLSQAHVGDPAEDMAWIYASVPVDCLDSIEGAYDLARTEGVDKHLRDRAELVSELSLARWLLHGVRAARDRIIEDAVAMLDDLADQVGDEPLIEPREPRLAPVPGERVTAAPDATTHEVTMVPVDADDDDSSDDLDDGYDDGVDDGDDVDGVDGVIGIIDDDDPDTAPVTPLRLAHDSGSSPEGA